MLSTHTSGHPAGVLSAQPGNSVPASEEGTNQDGSGHPAFENADRGILTDMQREPQL
jgi:hypothetical protein